MSGKKARPSRVQKLHKIAYAYCRSPRRATKHGPAMLPTRAGHRPPTSKLAIGPHHPSVKAHTSPRDLQKSRLGPKVLFVEQANGMRVEATEISAWCERAASER